MVKVGRTEFQDAVLTTLGPRDGRLRRGPEPRPLANLQMRGTPARREPRRHGDRHRPGRARGSTSSAWSTNCASSPASGLARAENLIEATQNADVFVEVSGILKACAVHAAQDLLRPAPALQRARGRARRDAAARPSGRLVDHARQGEPGDPRGGQPGRHAGDRPTTRPSPRPCAAGSLELNPFLPLIADCLLDSLDLLERGLRDPARDCVEGIEADEAAAAAGRGSIGRGHGARARDRLRAACAVAKAAASAA